ncbi:MAG: anaerobic ribonucleoside-triphosphate reductase activating protein [bacterium]
MEISGLVKTSLIDYPGKIAAVIFTQGCNFHCGFCHNPDLINMTKGSLTEREVIDFLEKRIDTLDGVVITGGEPTVHKDIELLIKKIKEMGFLVKLDTNGSDPVKLMSLIEKELVDYIAMDIKGPLDKYSIITAYMNKKVIQESIKIIMMSGIKFEFRTTVLPYYHELSDFNQIGELIKGAPLYTIQGFRPQITYNKKLQKEEIFTTKELEEIKQVMENYVDKVVIHENL